ncbi:hypothetical protein [Salmonella sp. s54925]|uniref:lysozyme n=1 Tax=Salmonella sp. s54925 TaxID=3159674 RepID=UPI00397F5108
MKTIFLCFALLASSIGYYHAATKTKCQVVSALRAQRVPDGDLRNWLCLVKHESSYRYDVTNTNSNLSKDYGIYQLNNKYWCDRGTRSDTACWKINTYGCGVPCNSLLNSDIDDDTKCAVKIKNCNSFRQWYGWTNNCQDVSGSEFDYSSC